MLSAVPGKKLQKYVPDYTLFDLETTGFSVVNDAIIEISALKVRSGRIIDEFTSLVNPGFPIPYMASCVNGISDAMVQSAPDFHSVLSNFLNFIGNDILVGHNIHAFDLRFLNAAAMDYWGKTLGNDYVDTLLLARSCLTGIKSYKLTDLANYYAVSTDGAHRALYDCRMNYKIFEYLSHEQPRKTINVNSRVSGNSMSKTLCPKCGKPLKIRTGKFGRFWGCTGYPACRYTKNISK